MPSLIILTKLINHSVKYRQDKINNISCSENNKKTAFDNYKSVQIKLLVK